MSSQEKLGSLQKDSSENALDGTPWSVIKKMIRELKQLKKVAQALDLPYYKIKQFVRKDPNKSKWFWQFRKDTAIAARRARQNATYAKTRKLPATARRKQLQEQAALMTRLRLANAQRRRDAVVNNQNIPDAAVSESLVDIGSSTTND